MKRAWILRSVVVLTLCAGGASLAHAGEPAPPRARASRNEVLPDGTRVKVTKLPSSDVAPAPARPQPPARQRPRPSARPLPRPPVRRAPPVPGLRDSKAQGTPSAAAAPARPTAGKPAFDKGRYAALIKAKAEELRQKVVARIRARILARQQARMEAVADVLGWISLGGVLLFFAPLFLRKRYPGQLGTMFKYSLLAAVTFTVAILLFTVLLVLLRSVQAELGPLTNPQLAVIDAVFENIEKYNKEFAELGPVFVEPFFQQMHDGQSPLFAYVGMVANIQHAVSKDIAVFKTLLGWLEAVRFVFAYVPVALVLVAVGLFLLSIKDVVLRIVSLPARAARGELGSGRSVLGDVMRTVGREFLVTLGVIGGVVVLSLLAGVLLSRAMVPAVDALLGYVMASLFYLMTVKNASTTYAYLSVGGTVLFLLLNVVVLLAAYIFWLTKWTRILKQRFHEKVPLRTHKRFFGWGTLSVLWALVLPYLFILAAEPFIDRLIDKLAQSHPPRWVALLVSGPAILVLGFLVVFWATRGLRALQYLARYNVKGPSPAAGSAAEAVEYSSQAAGQ